ncbi:MAG: exodeoxyribonuclease V subunit alpha [Kofleriaceae bacterium]|jgi:exodeoxyribonuclease V alpha subunit|nr:exodeoxyribonuclease V subunit alpha [Kofleriaceae bacterium]MBP9165806.1 exodeoxyribonuclease V subunit alpha [Kofleriaceae bacterium]MBP9857955.1 exodeoxyribonuclease V subunit alpha [Kofleriaceae bacterium]
MSGRTLALSPLGAVRRARGGAAAGDDALFRRLGVGARRCDLGDAGLYLAEELVAWNRFLGGREKQSLALGVLALMLAVRSGSTRLPLDPKGPGAELVASVVKAAGLGGEVSVREVMKDLRNLASGFHGVAGPARRTGDQASPLVVDDDALYPHRLWWLEVRLAERLAARGRRALMTTTEAQAAIAATRDRLLSDEQAAAAAVALTAGLSVITGGPGTGKTATLAAVVAALRHAGLADDELALAAPTGKAAHRMGESVRGRLGAAAAAGVPTATLHRLLRSQPGGGFHHGEGNPLPYRAVIVDEASMIDLALMERLVAALSDDARLILIGDPDQLPSVEAGQVLTDLIADAAAGAGAAGVARLTRSYRVEAGEDGAAILAAAAAVLAGEAKRLGPGRGDRLAAVRPSATDVVGRGVEFVAADVAGTLSFVDHWWRQRWRRLDDAARREFRRVDGRWQGDDADALAELLAAHEASRLLAVTRSGALGSVGLCDRCHALVLAEASVDGAPEFLPGEPVLQTRNDYARGLWNGDQGVVVRVSDDGGPQHYRVVFRKSLEVADDDGRIERREHLVPFPIDALRGGLELAWAMTVHKSQGSEFGQVAFVLPEADVPLLCRELVYTALTRARSSAVVVGAPEVLAEGGARRAVRSTGFGRRLHT